MIDEVYLCPTGCEICLSQSICETCSSGFILDADTDLCTRCKGSCHSCDSNSPDQCFSCHPGSYLSSGSCLKCDSSCRLCDDDANTCTACNVGYLLDTITCLQCPENCDICSDADTCTQCRPGYTSADNGTCLQCASSCGKCDADRIMDCMACMCGFELVTVNETDSCERCPEGKCT